jgi:Ser/Thr protein kinase RdoA (MazF antagonist)
MIVSMSQADFHHLTPETVLNYVEDALDTYCSTICRPLNSYINRVYELETEDREPLVVKFYRPGRWTTEALRDELTFLAELNEAEVPVIPPEACIDGERLQIDGDTRFAIFPKMGGRIVDEPSNEEWVELGRLVARVHDVGRSHDSIDRVTFTPADCTEAQISHIVQSGSMPEDISGQWEDAALALVDRIDPLFDEPYLHRIHGDLHPQNLIFRPGERFYIIDFDDMAIGPAVQDIWMLLPGRLADSIPETSLFLEGYETFLPFDRASLRLIEPLRFMRFIHFTAWCVTQAEDGGFARLAPDWGNHAYWQQEIRQMQTQATEIEDALTTALPHL